MLGWYGTKLPFEVGRFACGGGFLESEDPAVAFTDAYAGQCEP